MARTTRSEKHREALIEMAKTWSEEPLHLHAAGAQAGAARAGAR